MSVNKNALPNRNRINYIFTYGAQILPFPILTGGISMIR